MAGVEMDRANANNAEPLHQQPDSEKEKRDDRTFFCICIFIFCYIGTKLLGYELIHVEPFYRLTQQYWMNAATFYREKLDLVLKHATDSNMLILQSIGTCFALLWSVGSQRRSVLGY